MQVHAAVLSHRPSVWAVPRPAADEARTDPVDAPPEAKKPQKEEDDAAETWTRRAAGVGQALMKIPRALLFIPEFLKFAVFDTLIPLIGFTATLGGVVGAVGLGAAGAMETIDGVKKKDNAVILSGLGEMARGGYIGGLSWNSFHSGSFTPGGVGTTFGLIHGALNLSSGLVKMRRPDREQKIVGMLEAGMGAAAFATLCVPGPLKLPALVANGALSATRSIYMNREKIQDWRLNHRQKLHDSWEKFKDIFREEKKPDHAGT